MHDFIKKELIGQPMKYSTQSSIVCFENKIIMVSKLYSDWGCISLNEIISRKEICINLDLVVLQDNIEMRPSNCCMEWGGLH